MYIYYRSRKGLITVPPWHFTQGTYHTVYKLVKAGNTCYSKTLAPSLILSNPIYSIIQPRLPQTRLKYVKIQRLHVNQHR